MIFTSPAKINLYLKVVRKRDDGYHEIETLFERVSLLDRITIEPAQENTTITCNDTRVPVDENSLLGRAVRVFRKKSGSAANFSISLEKNIPIGAGMGGGSSNAATVLKGINQMSGDPLTEEALLGLGRELGADVPFFLSESRFAYGKGRGDIIQEAETSLEMWQVLVNPPFEASTREIYGKISAFSLTKDEGVDRMFSAFLSEGDITAIAENLYNDLQAVVLRDFPVLEKVFSELRKAGAWSVLVSGSGPTVFGIFDREKAIEAADRLQQLFPEEENWNIFVAKTY